MKYLKNEVLLDLFSGIDFVQILSSLSLVR